MSTEALTQIREAATRWTVADLRREMALLIAEIDADHPCSVYVSRDGRWPIVRAMRRKIAKMERGA